MFYTAKCAIFDLKMHQNEARLGPAGELLLRSFRYLSCCRGETYRDERGWKETEWKGKEKKVGERGMNSPIAKPCVR